ncbi:MAG TPA: hypothetical protein VI479_17330 [Blastocatellia bacterium]
MRLNYYRESSITMTMKRSFCITIMTAGLIAGLFFALFPARAGRSQQPQEHPAIDYRNAISNDAVARLQRRLDEGAVKLEYSEPRGYLDSALKHLGVPASSQGLVFSKTSFQLHRIMPSNPRAIYFNDETYIGWVRGGDVLEVAAIDPKLGGVFYILEQDKASRPRFRRNDECLQCHVSNGARNVPGFVVRSVRPDARGYPIAPLGGFVTDHASPLKERWGGWYVSGAHGAERHLGNMRFDENGLDYNPAQLPSQNLASLEPRFDTRNYITPHSDIVALMVLEHQTQMHNLLTRLSYETRMALRDQEVINEALGRPTDEWSDGAKRRITRAVDDALKYLLFAGETRFTSPIEGTSDFAREFSSFGPKDKQGRSLRDFDLTRKLFRYRCSYLIYSEAFDALPKPALDQLHRQLWLVLTGQNQDKEFTTITAEERKAVLEILRETKKNLPDYFSQAK